MRSPGRVAVIGPAGSGKSTLAVRVASSLGLPVMHMDDVLREPRASGSAGSRRAARRPEDQRTIISEAVAEPAWVIEGSYWRTVDILLNAADLVVFLDPPVHAWLAQLLKRESRSFWRWLRRERVWRSLSIQLGFLLWQPWYPLRERPRVLRALRELEPGSVVHLRGQRAVDRFVTGLKADREIAAE